ncbi:MAG TPA: hypothetical protein VL048_15190 [Xanthobacteraceae bacterium]|nr:hypothetical protein [Xanthobacteraceae bacterium]
MKRRRIFWTVVAALLLTLAPNPGSARSAPPHVYSDAGNVYLEQGGAKTKLTASEMDVDPVLAPNRAYVVYTRQGRGRTVHGYDTSQVCSTEPRPDELRQINAGGGGDRLLLKGRRGGPEHQLCDFRNKQFSSDGRRLYFLTPGWATSGALHVIDMRDSDERFVMPANDFLVLSFCTNKYKDDLVVLQHRYFLLGGSYDWYWLYDPTGRKELGPLGEFGTPDDMLRQAHGVWCAAKP